MQTPSFTNDHRAAATSRRTRIRPTRFALIAAFLLWLATPLAAAFAGNDFIDTELRVDQSAVNGSRDYLHTIWVGGRPNNGAGGDFTTAWLGVDLAVYNGTVYSAKFSQVGFMTDKVGVRWFVYSEAGATCLSGTAAWGTLGCVGNYSDRATIGSWQKVEMVTYGQGFWIARVYDKNGSALDVAKFNSSSLKIYRGMAVTEEGYSESTDPYLLASFWHNHPKYMVWGTGFVDWPASSSGHNNYLFTSPSGICSAHYSANLNWGGDARVWFAGSTGPTPAVCSANPQF